MIGGVLLLMLGGFCMGGAIAFFRQRKPFPTVLLLFALAFGFVILGALVARDAA